MADHNMNHLNFLDLVALGDVAEVRRKETTYQGSWKIGGGTNAWAMIVRKIDRLAILMRRPVTPAHFDMTNVDDTIKALETGQSLPGSPAATADMLQYLRDCYVNPNIFAQVRSDPTGADGSALAEVRDLRRYLLLVEAEMMARGVVPVPEQLPVMTRHVVAEVVVRGEPRPLAEFVKPETSDLYPWVTSPGELETLFGGACGTAIDHFYEVRTPSILVLEPAVRNPAWEWLKGFPTEYGRIAAAYTDVDQGSGLRVLDVGNAPVTERERWETFVDEYNPHEMQKQPAWLPFLYSWREGANKWAVKDEHRAWVAW